MASLPSFTEDRTADAIRCFYRVYDELGWGYLESVYRNAMVEELRGCGLTVDHELPIDVWYRDTRVGSFRADIVVDRRLILELKASEHLTDADRKQLLNYLRGSSIQVGLLLHFGPRPSFQRLIYTNDRKPFRGRR